MGTLHFWKNEQGQSTGTNIMVYVLLFLLVFSIWKIGYPFFEHLLFDEYVEKQANWDRENQTAPLPMDTIVELLYSKARGYGVVIPEKQIKIDFENPSLIIKINYFMPINVYLFKFDWKFYVEKRTTKI